MCDIIIQPRNSVCSQWSIIIIISLLWLWDLNGIVWMLSVLAIWKLSTTMRLNSTGFHWTEQSLSNNWQNGSFMSQEVCSFLLMEVKRKKYTYHYDLCFIKKGANGCSLTQSLACFYRHQCFALIAIAAVASASLNFTLNQPVLCLL